MINRNCTREKPAMTNCLLFLYFTLGFLMFVSVLPKAETQSSCRNPNRKVGNCLSVYDCPSILEVIKKISLTADERDFIRRSECQGGSGRQPYVCCTADKGYISTDKATDSSTNVTPIVPRPDTNPSPSNGMGNVLPQPPRCGRNSLGDKIYNGKDTALDEFPWMVLLSYNEKSGKRSLNCGGSLINQRYVLTAAHCIIGQIEREIGPLATVRLGEYDISSEIDCVDGDDCNNKVVEVGYEEVIPHPEYDETTPHRHNDIGLIRLSMDVTYTDFISPVCLPLATSNRMAINTGELLTVSGWGRTLLARMSNKKQRLDLPITDHDACVSKFSTRKINLISSQLCAGGQFAKDSCDGDSGGPLMRQNAQKFWFLEGVVSFGNRCGLEGWPGVYTRVADYMDWIEQNLKP